jgi:hypothetical protein
MTETGHDCNYQDCGGVGYAELCGYCPECWVNCSKEEQDDLMEQFGMKPNPALHPITERVINNERHTVERWSLPPKTHWLKRLTAYIVQACISGVVGAGAALAAAKFMGWL